MNAQSNSQQPSSKGLRSLAAFDTNADGRIDALDPVYAHLKVWQDLDQDGNNTHSLQIGPNVETAQDETNDVQELRSLADWSISTIDYGNSRYEYASTPGSNELGYGSISTLALEAQDEGVLFTVVGICRVRHRSKYKSAGSDQIWEMTA
jgi:hypothetical protein